MNNWWVWWARTVETMVKVNHLNTSANHEEGKGLRQALCVSLSLIKFIYFFVVPDNNSNNMDETKTLWTQGDA